MRKIYFKTEVNEKLLNVSFDAENATHSGKSYVEFFEDITEIKIRGITKSGNQKLLDQTIDICKWLQNPRTNFLISLFKHYVNAYNPELLQCPIKKGFYVAAEARERISNATTFFPSFIPLRGNLTVIKIASGRVKSTMHHLIRATVVYELY